MNCPHCSLAIEETDPKMIMPCCTVVYHSACSLQMLANSPYWYPVRCACGILLCGNEDPVPGPIPDTPEYNADIRDYKKVLAEANKARRELNKAIVPIKRTFKEATAAHIAAIKTLKAEATAAIKATPEHKIYGSKFRKHGVVLKKLRAKYIYEAARRSRFGRYRDRIYWILRSAFRVRI